MSKGKVAEREVARIIKEWWSSVEPDAEFVRTPMSGGWGKTREVRAGFRASGDLMTTAKRFPFTIESKRRERWNLERLMAGKPSPVWAWWRQAQTQGDEMDLVPLLWLRRNREDWRIILPHGFACEHRLKAHTFLESDAIDACLYGAQVPALMLASDLLALPAIRFALVAP